jgi:hypothetical protein
MFCPSPGMMIEIDCIAYKPEPAGKIRSRSKVSLTEDHHVIQTLPSNGANHPLRECIPPGTPGCADDLLHTQGLDSTMKLVSIRRIPLADQVALATLFGQNFHYLLPGPFSARRFRDSEVKDLPALMLQHEKHEQHLHADRRYREEVNRDAFSHVILEERLPGL